jgi:hypothetical protein
MAKVKELKFGSSISFQDKNEHWYRAEATITVELEDGDDVAEAKKKLWNTVNDEIANQVENLLDTFVRG